MTISWCSIIDKALRSCDKNVSKQIQKDLPKVKTFLERYFSQDTELKEAVYQYFSFLRI